MRKISRTFEQAKLAYPIGALINCSGDRVPKESHNSIHEMHKFISIFVAKDFCYIEKNLIRFNIY